MNEREHPVGRPRSAAGRLLVIARLKLFWRLLIRPLVAEPVRTALTVLAVALGVAVVLAMDLAGDAATGSFHSSLEAISGQQDFEITAAGGVPERLAGELAREPYDWTITPRIEGFAQAPDSKQTFALLGLDLIAQSNAAQAPGATSKPQDALFDPREFSPEDFAKADSIWVGKSLHKTRGEALALLVNDRALTFTVRGSFADEPGAGSALVMDIASAQAALGRGGRLDRLFLGLPGSPVSPAQNGGDASADAARRCATAPGRCRYRRKPQDARCVSLESAAAQLHRLDCRRVSDLQLHFGFRGAAPRGDWYRQGARGRAAATCSPLFCSSRVHRPRRLVARPSAWPRHGDVRSQTDGQYRQRALRQQPPRRDRARHRIGPFSRF
jgi:hypothetical protein